MSCKNITFGAVNNIETAALASVPESATDLDWIKSHHRARKAKWDVGTDTVVVTGTHDEYQLADYFALIGSNLPANAVIKIEAFDADDWTGTDLLQLGDIEVGKLIPLGIWRVELDKYNVRTKARGDSPLTAWFSERVKYKSWKLTITHGHTVSAPVYNSTPEQDSFGVVSLEAEDAIVTSVGGNTWALTNDATASGGESLHINGGFYTTPNTGPSFAFVFDATQTGTHKVWVRVKSPVSGGNDSYHVDFDGSTTTTQNIPVDDAWHWIESASVQLTDGTTHSISISAREPYLYIDKVVILPNADPAPTGTGPAASSFGVEGSTANVQVRLLRMGTVWRPEKNYEWGYSSRMLTDPEIGYSSDGHPVVVREPKEVKRLSYNLSHMTDNDRFMYQEMKRERAGRPLYFFAHPEHEGWIADASSFLGIITDGDEYLHLSLGRHQVQQTIEEV